jgi:hypothetical protein
MLAPTRIGTRRQDLAHLRLAADVAGVDADLVHAGGQRREPQLVVEVDVGHHRHRRAAHDLA